MNDVLSHTAFPQKLRCLQAMLIGVFLKINIMEQSYDSPVLCLLPIALLGGEPSHDSLYRQCMLDMKRILVVFLQ